VVLEYKRAAHDLLDQSPHTLHLRDASHFDVSVFLGQEITFTIATDSVEMRNSFKRAREGDEPTGLQDDILVKRAMVGRGPENVVANPLQAQQVFEDWGGQDPHNTTSLNAGMELNNDSNPDPRETGTDAGTLASNICYGAVSSFLIIRTLGYACYAFCYCRPPSVVYTSSLRTAFFHFTSIVEWLTYFQIAM
jgi:hypothetical protein